MVAGAASGSFKLGPQILLLADAMRKDIAHELHVVLQTLAQDTGETVDLAVLRNDNMTFIDQVVGTHRLRTVSAIGEAFPLTVTANGKAALVLLQDESARRIISRELSVANSGTKNFPVLEQELNEIRTSGYALDVDEHTTGISAAGIAFETANAIYAISIPAPTNRFLERKEFLVKQLLAIPDKIHSVVPDARFLVVGPT